MLDRARFLIITEVSEVIREGSAAVENRLDFALNKCIAARAKNLEKAKAAKPVVKTTRKPS